MDAEVPHYVSKIGELGQALTRAASHDDGSAETRRRRRELLDMSKRLTNALQNEGQIAEGYLYGTIDVLLLKIGADLGVFKALAAGGKPVTLHQLCAQTGADEVLLARIMRGLTSICAVDEAGDEVYTANKVTRAFDSVKGVSGLNLFHYVIHAGWMTFPKFLKETGYRNPTDPHAMPFNKQFNGEPYFDWLGRQPELLDSFHDFMTTQRVGHPQWLDFYPVEQELAAGADADGVFFVDVGGSVGHEVHALKARYPNVKGRMIVQDLPASVKRANTDDGMEAMAHDFFTEQPIKGARAYYLRSVLHDWDDDRCRTILGHLRDAMKPGYSRILVNEFSIPIKGACTFATHSDFMVMSVNAAVERTERQWYQLIESAGLRIHKIWTLEPDAESLIEVRLA